MGARGMRIAGDGQSSHDPIAVDGHEDRRVGMPTNGAQVSALVRSAPPGVGRQQPLACLLPDRRRQCDEVGGICRLGGTNRDHRTMHPSRRAAGRPPPPGRPRVSARPRRRRRRRGSRPPRRPGRSRRPRAPRRRRPASRPRVDGLAVDVEPRAGDRLLDGKPLADDAGDHLEDRAREPNGARAADDESRLVVREHERRSHHARKPGTRIAGLLADHVELAEHVVQLEAVAEDARPGAERRREGNRCAVAVDDRDVRRPGRARPARRAGRGRGVAGGERGRERARLGDGAADVVASPVEHRQTGLDDGPAARGRRHRQDERAADRRLERHAWLDLVPGEVLGEVREEQCERLGARVADQRQRRDEVTTVDPPRRAVDAAPAASR